MQSLLTLLSVMLCLLASACATHHVIADRPPAVAASSGAPALEPGTMVVRRPLVRVGSSDLLEPIAVPTVPVSEVPRTAGVATMAASASGCDNAPGSVHVTNATEFPVTLTVDGEPLTVLGVGEIRRFIGPRSTAYLCLDPSRPHAFEGFALRRVNDGLYAIPNDFRSEVAMGSEGPVTFTVSYALIPSGR